MQLSDAAAARRRMSYDLWCECLGLLLGRGEAGAGRWPALYAAGLTPLQAARETAFSRPEADKLVWM